jgi:protoheme IX farnesyltransferase
MELSEGKNRAIARGSLKDYLNLIKPRETGLLVFIGLVSAVIAGDGMISISRFLLTFTAILIASAGANGLTNYLDRDLDARMERTKRRALPAGRIYPPSRALFFTATLSLAGLIIAWYLNPYAFLADLIGTGAAVVYRKRVTCVFPQGMIASCAPVLMGWFAVTSRVNWEVLLLCVLIAAWLPSHIWSIMLAHRDDYRQAGINYFPINRSFQSVTGILVVFCILLYAASIGVYFLGNFGWLYLVLANLSGIAIVFSSVRLWLSKASADAWKLYKLSAFPYLGLLFLAMSLDIWLRF